MFQFGRFPAHGYLVHHALAEYCSAGFPHSDIHGSRLICSSPWLFAACHVLLRLLMPRHSPCALFSLTYFGPNSLASLELCRFNRSLLLTKLYLPFFKVFHFAVTCFVPHPFPECSPLCCLAFPLSSFQGTQNRPKPVVENSGIEPLTS